MRRAFSLVPTKVFTLRFCLRALKKSCRVRDWRGADCARFQPLPIRTAREVFPQAAHPVSFVERVMSPAGRRPLSREALQVRAEAGFSSPSKVPVHRRDIRYSTAAIPHSTFAAVFAAS